MGREMPINRDCDRAIATVRTHARIPREVDHDNEVDATGDMRLGRDVARPAAATSQAASACCSGYPAAGIPRKQPWPANAQRALELTATVASTLRSWHGSCSNMFLCAMLFTGSLLLVLSISMTSFAYSHDQLAGCRTRAYNCIQQHKLRRAYDSDGRCILRHHCRFALGLAPDGGGNGLRGDCQRAPPRQSQRTAGACRMLPHSERGRLPSLSGPRILVPSLYLSCPEPSAW
jgi:hypothetical protein